MRIASFAEFSGIDSVSYEKPLYEKKFSFNNTKYDFELSDLAINSCYRTTIFRKYAIDYEGTLHIWDEGASKFNGTSITVEDREVFRGPYENRGILTKGAFKQSLRMVDLATGKDLLKLTYRANCTYFNGEQFLLQYPRGKGVELKDSKNEVIWHREGFFNDFNVITSYEIAVYERDGHLYVMKLNNGEDIYSKKLETTLSRIYIYDHMVYVFLKGVVLIFDPLKLQVINELYVPDNIDFTFDRNLLYLADRDSAELLCYDLDLTKLISSQNILKGFYPSGGGLIVDQNALIVSVQSVNPLDRIGRSYKAFLSTDEFFSDNFKQEIEPDYFEVHEEADVEGGNNLRITLDTSINFDTLYRHLSVALQNIPFRHGNYGWAATLDEEKPVNENFNGKVIADLSDHVFTSEQRDLLEEVIQEAMEFYANRQITSGDGKGTPCYVVSVIPVAE